MSNSNGHFPPFNRQRILVVDDNMVTIILTVSLLRAWNLEVDVAGNGLEAIRRSLIKPYDLVLMDLDMPVMMGVDATRQIRRIGEAFSHVPMLAFSALDAMTIQKSIGEGGMNGFVRKPFTPEALYSELKKFLG